MMVPACITAAAHVVQSYWPGGAHVHTHLIHGSSVAHKSAIEMASVSVARLRVDQQTD